MTILYYDPKSEPADKLVDRVAHLQEVIDDKVLVVPKDYDVLLHCSVDQLLSVRAMIDSAISELVAEEEPNIEIKSNSKYLN